MQRHSNLGQPRCELLVICLDILRSRRALSVKINKAPKQKEEQLQQGKSEGRKHPSSKDKEKAT